MGILLRRATRISVVATGALVCLVGIALVITAVETGEFTREMQKYVAPSIVTIVVSTLGQLCALAGIVGLIPPWSAAARSRGTLNVLFGMVIAGLVIACLSPFLFAAYLLVGENLGGPFAVFMLVGSVVFGVTSVLLVVTLRSSSMAIVRERSPRSSRLDA